MNEQMAAQTFAICVLFFEKVDQTIECVQSFLPSGVPIYILNNNSSAESTQVLKDFCKDHPQVTIFDSDKNLGVSGGRNFLIQHTTEQWMFFVDNDITIKTANWLERIRGHMLHNPTAEAFIPRLYNLHDRSYCKHQSFKLKGRRVIRKSNFFSDKRNSFPGGAAIIRRALFDRLGLYDENMFVGFEDYELCIRGLKTGLPSRAYEVEDIQLVHDHRVALKQVDKDSILVRYDIEKHQTSDRQLLEKHNVVMEDDWQQWLGHQVNKQVYGIVIPKKNIIERISNKLLRTIGNIFK